MKSRIPRKFKKELLKDSPRSCWVYIPEGGFAGKVKDFYPFSQPLNASGKRIYFSLLEFKNRYK